MPAYFLLGGRAFRSAATAPTFAQAGYLMGVVRANRLDVVINDGGDLLAAILETGSPSKLLAGLLVEDDGRPWRRDDALANVGYFDGLTAEEDHAQLMAALEALLAGFFPSATGSSTVSPISSTPVEPRKRRRPRRNPSLKSEPSTTSGPMSSPPSPSSTASA